MAGKPLAKYLSERNSLRISVHEAQVRVRFEQSLSKEKCQVNRGHVRVEPQQAAGLQDQTPPAPPQPRQGPLPRRGLLSDHEDHPQSIGRRGEGVPRGRLPERRPGLVGARGRDPIAHPSLSLQ